jgi:RNA polymerase-binding transcription factor DksA
MDDGLLLQSSIGLQDPRPLRGEGMIWNALQDLKETVSEELLAEGPICREAYESQGDATTERDREIEWRYRKQLVSRLLAISDAQDRLFDHEYGQCVDCHKPIDARRLEADPVASRCIVCQLMSESVQ